MLTTSNPSENWRPSNNLFNFLVKMDISKKNLLHKKLQASCIDEQNDQGTLQAFEFNDIPFDVKRAFTVCGAKPNAKRGLHAHKKCKQALFCLSGSIEVSMNDGLSKFQVLLKPNGFGVLLENGIWAVQNYIENQSALLVFCDQPFEENDYIRDYQEFLDWCISNQ